MGSFIDETGRRYGMLAVIGKAKRNGPLAYWTCRCDCGIVRDVNGHSLRSGRSRSCGCARPKQRERALVGSKFGSLTVVSANGKKNGRKSYLCRCDCGESITVAGYNLRSLKIQSCGCRRWMLRASTAVRVSVEHVRIIKRLERQMCIDTGLSLKTVREVLAMLRSASTFNKKNRSWREQMESDDLSAIKRQLHALRKLTKQGSAELVNLLPKELRTAGISPAQ